MPSTKEVVQGGAAAAGEAWGGPLAGAAAGYAAGVVVDAFSGGAGGYSGPTADELVAKVRRGEWTSKELETWIAIFERDAADSDDPCAHAFGGRDRCNFIPDHRLAAWLRWQASILRLELDRMRPRRPDLRAARFQVAAPRRARRAAPAALALLAVAARFLR